MSAPRMAAQLSLRSSRVSGSSAGTVNFSRSSTMTRYVPSRNGNRAAMPRRVIRAYSAGPGGPLSRASAIISDWS
ncbi:hypothetical protein SALBM217S_00416 [Streptomyces griseoloalbus]